jgi:hypothetical protein
MKRRKPEKGFDCVGFKRKAQREIYEEIKGLSPEEEIEYFRCRAAESPLGKWRRSLEHRSEAGRQPTSRSTIQCTLETRGGPAQRASPPIRADKVY